MGLLSRDWILSVDDAQTETVEVPEWGGSVLVRGMSGTDRDHWEAETFIAGKAGSKVNFENLRARVCAACIVGEDGQLLFGPGDVAALGRKSAAALDRVFEVATRLSRIRETDVTELVGK